MAALLRLPRSLVPWSSLNWLNDWGRKINFGGEWWDGCAQKLVGMAVQNCWGIEEGSVSGDCKDDFVNKYGWNREVKIDWRRGAMFWSRF